MGTAMACLLTSDMGSLTSRERAWATRLANTLSKQGISLDEYAAHTGSGQRLCRRCWQWKPGSLAEFAAAASSGDGLSSYCRACMRKLGNACYRNRPLPVEERPRLREVWGVLGYWSRCAEQVPPYVFPLPKADEKITCFQCRHCKLLPYTDFSKLPEQIVPIYCAKWKKAKPCELVGCDIADPRPAMPKGLNEYWRKYGPLGDKVRNLTDVGAAYLRAQWPVAPMAELEQAMGRSQERLRHLVREHKLGGARQGRMRPKAFGGKKFTPAQREYLVALYRTLDWPRQLHYRLGAAEHQKRVGHRERVMAHVATLGPSWTWKQIERATRKAVSRSRRTSRRGAKTQRIPAKASI